MENQEKYQPSHEEVEEAEEMMTFDQEMASNKRELDLKLKELMEGDVGKECQKIQHFIASCLTDFEVSKDEKSLRSVDVELDDCDLNYDYGKGENILVFSYVYPHFSGRNMEFFIGKRYQKFLDLMDESGVAYRINGNALADRNNAYGHTQSLTILLRDLHKVASVLNVAFLPH